MNAILRDPGWTRCRWNNFAAQGQDSRVAPRAETQFERVVRSNIAGIQNYFPSQLKLARNKQSSRFEVGKENGNRKVRHASGGLFCV